MNPRISVFAESQGWAIPGLEHKNAPIPFTLNGVVQISPPPPYNYNSGIQLLIVDEHARIVIHQYFVANTAADMTDLWNQLKQVVESSGAMLPTNTMVLATFGWDYDFPPSGDTYNWLIANGAGQTLQTWSRDGTITQNSYYSASSAYILATNFYSGANGGKEAFDQNNNGHARTMLDVQVVNGRIENVLA